MADAGARGRAFSATGGYVALVVCLAVLAATGTAASVARALPAEWLAFAVFAALGLGWTARTFSVARARGGRVAVTLAPAAFLGLIPLVPPGLTALAAVIVCLADWAVHRRAMTQGVYNIAAVVCALWVATFAAKSIQPPDGGLLSLALHAVAGSIAFSLANAVLFLVVVRIATGRSARESGLLSFAALSNEVVIVCFAALLSTSWTIHPAMLAVPAVPLTLLFLLLGRLEQREAALRRRQHELQTLQELGLKVSAALDAQELGRVVTHLVTQDLRAAGAALLTVEPDPPRLVVAAFSDSRDARAAAPRELDASFALPPLLAESRPRIVRRDEIASFPWLEAFGGSEYLLQPLSILERREAVIVVFGDGAREPFQNEDADRLSGLARFIEVALTNARLYDDRRRLQEHFAQTEKMSALGQLVSGVAHELNNPLATVIGMTELCGAMDLPPRAEEMLQRIQREAQRSARIVRSLLTFARHHKPEVGLVDLGAVVREVVELRNYARHERPIEISAEVAADLPPVLADGHQIHQVVLNLVTNAEQAIGARKEGGSIVVRVWGDRRRVRIDVTDDGPGIAAKDLERVFNPFFTTKPVGQGTGLGLSICYGIVQEHGGTIRVSNTSGSGTTFTVELPAAGPPRASHGASDAAEEASAPEADGAPDGALDILVVDDEDGVRSVLAEALRSWGHRVVDVASGGEALDLLRERRFELAIVDLRMPGIDGEALFDRVQSGGGAAPRWIFSTGDAASRGARRFLDRAGQPLLLKPFTLLTLRETLNEAMGAAGPASAGAANPSPAAR